MIPQSKSKKTKSFPYTHNFKRKKGKKESNKGIETDNKKHINSGAVYAVFFGSEDLLCFPFYLFFGSISSLL